MIALVAGWVLAVLPAVAAQQPPSRGDPPLVLTPGEKIEGAIDDGDSVVETPALVAGGYTRDRAVVGETIRFEVAKAGTYHLDLKSHFFDAYLVLRDGEGRVVAEDDDGLIGTHARLVCSLEASIAYEAWACALHAQRGPFLMSLKSGRPPDLSPAEKRIAVLADAHESLAAIEAARGSEHPDVARGLDSLGMLLRAQGNHPEALPLLERALAIRTKSLGADHRDVGVSLNNLALILLEQGKFDEARPLFERALAVSEAALGPDATQVSVNLDNLASVLLREGDLARALPLSERALAIREKALGPEHFLVAVSLNRLGLILQRQGNWAGARPLFERALAIRETALAPQHPDVAESLNNIAMLLSDQGSYAAARPLMERALSMWERMQGPDHPIVATGLSNLALVMWLQGDYGGARPLYDRALSVIEKARGSEHPDVAPCLDGLALLLHVQGDLSGARPLYERALAIREDALGPDHADVARSLNNLASVLRIQGDYEGARPLFERALAIREKALGPDHPDVASSLNNLAILLRDQRDYAEAQPLYERGLAIQEKELGPDHQDVAWSVNNLALIAWDRGDLGGARSQYERGLAIQEKALGAEHPDVAQTVVRLATLLFDSGAKAEGDELLLENRRPRTAHLRRQLASLNAAEALVYVESLQGQQDLLLSQSSTDPSVDADIYASVLDWKGQVLRAARAGRARLRVELSAEERARLDRLQAISAQLLPTVQRTFSKDQEPLTAVAVQSLMDERGRLARELESNSASDALPAPTCDQVRDALPKGAALVSLVVHPIYRPAQRDGERVITKGHWTEPCVTAWVARGDESVPARIELGPAAAIGAAIRSSLQQVTGARGASLAAPVDVDGTLRQLIWDPLASHLEGIGTVFVSPDGVLATLPWEILRSTDGRYLVEDRGFVYLTDPTSVVALSASNKPRRSGSLLAMGHVDYDHAAEAGAAVTVLDARQPGGGSVTTSTADPPAPSSDLTRGAGAEVWKSLPSTGTEASQIQTRHAHAFIDGESLVLSGDDATEERLKQLLPRHDVLHLATHGYFYPEGWASLAAAVAGEQQAERDGGGWRDEGAVSKAKRLQGYHPGLLSGLVCAGVNAKLPVGRDDGYLTAEEVGWLDLSKADLVVLSACDTGLGRPQSGEGLLGLRRAVLEAGARTVVSSLWSVPDQQTSELMDRFYRNLWELGMGAHAALRTAQLETIADNRARYDGDARPVTWGAFVLDGDWR